MDQTGRKWKAVQHRPKRVIRLVQTNQAGRETVWMELQQVDRVQQSQGQMEGRGGNTQVKWCRLVFAIYRTWLCFCGGIPSGCVWLRADV